MDSSQQPGLRIGYLSGFRPKKLGTGEDRLITFSRAARERGHSLTFFGGTPAHPEVAAALEAVGAAWRSIGNLRGQPLLSAAKTLRGFDVLQLNMIPPRGRLAIASYAAWPAKVLFVDRVSGLPAGEESPRPFWGRQMDRVTLLRVHQVVGITEYVRLRAKNRFQLPEARTCTIYNGVNTERFAPAPGTGRQGGPLRILTVAALIPEKGVDRLLRAVASLKSVRWELTVVGEGPEAESLERMAAELGVEAFTRFLGLRDDVPELLKNTDVMVHPAIWQEALGNTVLEGMSSGCAVVASRVGGIPELAEDGKEAMLVPAGDPEALAEVLALLGERPHVRIDLGKAARARVLRDFSLNASVARHLDCCEAAARGELFS